MDDQDMQEIKDEEPLAAPSADEIEDAAEEVARKDAAEKTADELNNKYLRLYAEFDNYKKRVNRDREELAKYGNESLLYELLPAMDHLELALKHAAGEPNSGLVQGVEITFKELQRTLEKFGLRRIEALGKGFDPSVHHAMMQVEREDLDEKMVADELRAGYLFHDKVLRPSLVAVSMKPKMTGEGQDTSAED
ncbi:MAG: nucleotide exchange factor GrpE [Nitrospiraceae bacterium]|nr:nucleotide exchange factor GrpE [Nitrospiraceae bacterium]